MITELGVQNFKSWKDSGKRQVAPITGFFGANSSGKTSILQSLLMLKQTVERPFQWKGLVDFGDNNSLVNLGSIDDLIYQHKRDSELGISLSWKLSEKLSVADNEAIDFLSFDLTIINIQNLASLVSYNYKTEDIVFSVIQESRVNAHNVYVNNDYHGLARRFKCYGIQDGKPEALRIISTLQMQFENLFKSIRYLGPLREYPKPHYAWQGKHSSGVGKHGEDMVTALFSGRIQRRPIEEEIPRWLERLDLIDSFRLNPISGTEKEYEFLVRKYKDGPEVRLTDVGFGVSQILPVLVLCYYVPEGSILILEQPEAHLHPKVQSELADLLIEVVKNRKLQIILESHSEHLIYRFMRRISEEQISADDTAFYFCQMNEGTSEIEKLNMDTYGNITNWPDNFFGDATGDLIEKSKAEMKRKKEQGL